jgi:hypothetical protein
MQALVRSLGALVLVLLLSGQARAERLDPAAWFPARTIAYLEVNQPAQLAKEMDAVFKGSALDNLPNLLAAFREKNPPGERYYYYGPRVLEMLALMVGPEARAEFARTQGAAVALTGVGKTGQPEVVGVILPGDSHLPGLFMRSMFLFQTRLQTVGEVEGVRICRDRRQIYRKYGPRDEPIERGKEPKVEYEEYGPAIAVLPKVIILGSSVEAVGDVVRRIKGKQSADSLAAAKGFKEAAKLRERPGLFGYADIATLVSVMTKTLMAGPRFDEYRKRDLQEQIRYLEQRRQFEKEREKSEKREPRDYEAEIGQAKQRLEALEKAAAARKAEARKVAKLLEEQLGALRSAAGSLSLQDGALGLEIQVQLNPEHKSALAKLLPDQKVDLEVLHYVPADCPFALAKAMPSNPKWWPNLLEVVDALAGASGSKQAPSKALKSVEAKLGFDFGKDLFGKIKSVAVAAPPARAEIPKGGLHIPVLVIEAVDADAAKSLEALVPKLVALAHIRNVDLDNLPKPVTETVDGQTVYSLAGGDLPWRTAVQYGVRGRFLVLGQDPKFVAGALAGGAQKKGLLAEAKVAQAIKEVQKPVAVGVWSLGQSLTGLVRSDRDYHPRRRYYKEEIEPPSRKEGGERKGDDRTGQLEKLAQGYRKVVDRHAREMEQAVEALPPMVLSVVRQPDRLTLQMRQGRLRDASAKVLGVLVGWQLERGALEEKIWQLEDRYRREFEKLPPPPDRPIEKGPPKGPPIGPPPSR